MNHVVTSRRDDIGMMVIRSRRSMPGQEGLRRLPYERRPGCWEMLIPS